MKHYTIVLLSEAASRVLTSIADTEKESKERDLLVKAWDNILEAQARMVEPHRFHDDSSEKE